MIHGDWQDSNHGGFFYSLKIHTISRMRISIMTMKCGSGYVVIVGGKVVASAETAIEAKAKLVIFKKENAKR
jgi:hypothetical protein